MYSEFYICARLHTLSVKSLDERKKGTNKTCIESKYESALRIEWISR